MPWSQVPLGPGGFISGIELHADGTKLARTDTSRAYRCDAGLTRWVPVVTTASMPGAYTQPGYGTLPGCYAVAIAPSNSSRFYISWKGLVFRSDDKGDSWTATNRASDALMDPNNSMRGANKKLAVDPANPDVVIAGSKAGLSYTDDAGETWSTISTSSIPAAGDNNAGSFGEYLIAFDPSSSVVGGKTQRIYVSSYGNGLYRSIDGGGSWAIAQAGGPTDFWNLVCASDGKVYVIRDSNGPGGYTTDLYKLSSNSWTQMSTGSEVIINAVAVDPTSAQRILVANSQGNISVSPDFGLSWSGYGTHDITSTDIPWLQELYGGSRSFALYPGATLAFDPSAENTIYLGEGLGIVKGTAPSSQTVMHWNDASLGIEQLCAKRLLKPPGGRLITAVMDQGVFALDCHNFPSTRGTDNYFGPAWDAAYCPTDPETIAVLINQGFPPHDEMSGLSRDGGLTWTQFASKDFWPSSQHAGGMIACGTDPDNFVYIVGDYGTTDNQPHYTTDGGDSWLACSIPGTATSGATGWLDNYYFAKHTLCADQVTANTFYAYNFGTAGSTAGVYSSANKGADWSCVHSGAWPEGSFANARMVSVPGQAGHLFYCSGSSGNTDFGGPMRRSTNGGVDWSLTNTGEVIAVGFGKAKPSGADYPAIFIVGWVDEVYGIHRSDDDAATWEMIGDFPLNCFDTPIDITGDPDVYGACYISTAASGIFFYDPGVVPIVHLRHRRIN